MRIAGGRAAGLCRRFIATPVQSAFNVQAGGTRKARAAGTRQATAPSPRTARAAPPSTTGSRGATPNSSVSMNRAVASDTTRPTARPAATGRSPCAHLAGDALPRGAQGHTDGELATAADDPLGHRAEDAEADEHESRNREPGRHVQQEPADRDALRQHVLEHAHVAHGKQRVQAAHGLAHQSEDRGGIGYRHHSCGNTLQGLSSSPRVPPRRPPGAGDRRLDELTNALQPGDRLVVSELSRLDRSLGRATHSRRPHSPGHR